MQTVSRKRRPSRILSRSQALRGDPCSQAARCMTLPDKRSLLTSHSLESPSTAWLPFVPSAPIASSRPRRHDLFESAAAGKQRSSCLYLAPRNDIPRTSFQPERIWQFATSRSKTYNLTTKQRAPRSQKRAGAETTFRIAWIKHTILPWFCRDDPPVGGGSRQVILSQETAVVRDG